MPDARSRHEASFGGHTTKCYQKNIVEALCGPLGDLMWWRVSIVIFALLATILLTFAPEPSKAKQLGLLVIEMAIFRWPLTLVLAVSASVWITILASYVSDTSDNFEESVKLAELYKPVANLENAADILKFMKLRVVLNEQAHRFKLQDGSQDAAEERFDYLVTKYRKVYELTPPKLKNYNAIDANSLGMHRKTQVGYVSGLNGYDLIFIVHDERLPDRKMYYLRSGNPPIENVKRLVPSPILTEEIVARALQLLEHKSAREFMPAGAATAGFGSGGPDVETNMAENKRWNVLFITESFNAQNANLLIAQSLGVDRLLQ